MEISICNFWLKNMFMKNIDVIQLPFNIFDNSLNKKIQLALKRKKNWNPCKFLFKDFCWNHKSVDPV